MKADLERISALRSDISLLMGAFGGDDVGLVTAAELHGVLKLVGRLALIVQTIVVKETKL